MSSRKSPKRELEDKELTNAIVENVEVVEPVNVEVVEPANVEVVEPVNVEVVEPANVEVVENKRRKRRRTTKIYETADLRAILGKVFSNSSSCYSPPEVVQVVGWTKHSAKNNAKRLTVLVRRVTCNNNYHQFGGDGRIARSDVLEITTPSHEGYDKLTLKIDDENPYDRDSRYYLKSGKKEVYLMENDLDRTWQWCDY
jgi:hypothetical protein